MHCTYKMVKRFFWLSLCLINMIFQVREQDRRNAAKIRQSVKDRKDELVAGFVKDLEVGFLYLLFDYCSFFSSVQFSDMVSASPLVTFSLSSVLCSFL